MLTSPVLVIGAGLAGLSAAQRLRENGHNVIVLEAAGVVGGRLATDCFEEACFDSGAQFFTVREPRFAQMVDEWQAAGIVDVWSTGFAGASGRPRRDGHPRFRGVPGMAAIPDYLARGLDVRLNTAVVSANIEDGRWLLVSGQGETIDGRALILTPPLPVSLALLNAGGVELPAAVDDELAAIRYDPCIALLVELERRSGLPQPGAVQLHGEPITFVGDNRQKGVSAAAQAVTIHAGPQFSTDHWDTPDQQVVDLLLDEASFWLKAPVKRSHIRRWAHSIPTTVLEQRTLHIPGPPTLTFAGDVFGGPRVEGAVLSGLAAAQTS